MTSEYRPDNSSFLREELEKNWDRGLKQKRAFLVHILFAI